VEGLLARVMGAIGKIVAPECGKRIYIAAA